MYEIFIETFNKTSENNAIAKAISVTKLPILNGTRITIFETSSSDGDLLPRGIYMKLLVPNEEEEKLLLDREKQAGIQFPQL